MGFNKKIEDGNNLSEMKTDLAYRSLLIVIVSSNCDILKKMREGLKKSRHIILPILINYENKETTIDKVKDSVENTNADLGIYIELEEVCIINENGVVLTSDQISILLIRLLLREYPDDRVLIDLGCPMVVFEEVICNLGRPHYVSYNDDEIQKLLKQYNAKCLYNAAGELVICESLTLGESSLYIAKNLISYIEKSSIGLADHFIDVPNYIATPHLKVSFTPLKTKQLMKTPFTIFRRRPINL